MSTVTVMAWQRALLYRDGRLEQVLDPGRHRYSRRGTRVVTIDMRSTVTSLHRQELFTMDGVSVRVNTDLTWRVEDPAMFHETTQSPDRLLHIAAQNAVRARIGGLTLDAMLADRSIMSTGLARAVAEAVTGLGILVEAAGVRDLMLPGELRRAAMDVIVARQRGKAALEAARAESAALRSLKNTAELLERHPMLLKLRTLQVAAEAGAGLTLDTRDHGET
ncbi:MAG TPA: slipin family protein [Candidatus Stackebrandtia excrementipullorum]|nr:slipin family protein [Candidatus Stackebrandtia excrementipullorum]